MESESTEMRNRLLDNIRSIDGGAVEPAAEIQRATGLAGPNCSSKADSSNAENYASTRYLRSIECTPSGHEMHIDFDAEWESDVCAVCLCIVESTEEAGRLPCTCTAIYHRDCVARWLLRNNSCPLCRTSAQLPSHLFSSCDWGRGANGALWGNGGNDANDALMQGNAPSKSSVSEPCKADKAPNTSAHHTLLDVDFDEVAVMYHCAPPFKEDVDAMHLPGDVGFGDSDGDTAEIWMRMQGMGAQAAVVALSSPPSTNSGAASLYRGLVALQGAWIYSQGPSFMTMFHPECLRSPEYTAATGVVWRILDVHRPPDRAPPYIVQRIFLAFVTLQQALRSFGRWIRGASSSRTFIYVVLVVLILLTLLLGIHKVCAEVSDGTECTWGYQDVLMRRAIFYSSYR